MSTGLATNGGSRPLPITQVPPYCYSLVFHLREGQSCNPVLRLHTGSNFEITACDRTLGPLLTNLRRDRSAMSGAGFTAEQVSGEVAAPERRARYICMEVLFYRHHVSDHRNSHADQR